MDAPNGGSIPGLGEEDFPGFSADECPEVLPDISRHHSSLADLLNQDPALYPRLKGLQTPLGVGLARCIKVGMDNRGHHMVKTIGIVAGDEDCYEVFRDLFDPVIKRHLDSPSACVCDFHPTNLATKGLSLERADPSGRFVMSSQVRASRSLRGFRFPPAMSLEERLQVERISVRALEELDGPLRGEYFPLSGSQSHPTKPGGMRPEDEEMLRQSSLLFEAPDSTLRLCTGAGRHWPEARGVFVNGAQTFAAWVNEQEHLRLVSMHKGDQLQEAFVELVRATDALAARIRRDGEVSSVLQAFSWNTRLGFLTSNPANLGTAMHISIMVKLPLLGSFESESLTPPLWRVWCSRQRVQVRSACSDSGVPVPGLYQVSNADRIGLSEIELMGLVNEVVRRIVQMELRLEAGESFADLMEADLVRGSPPSADINEIRSRVKCLLESSLEDGSLEKSLRESAAEKVNIRKLTAPAMQEVHAKARATLLYGLASGLLGNAICSVGGQAPDPETAALVATASLVTRQSPLPVDAPTEQVCAQAVMNSIFNAVIVTKDDKHDLGGDVVVSTTPPMLESQELAEPGQMLEAIVMGTLPSSQLDMPPPVPSSFGQAVVVGTRPSSQLDMPPPVPSSFGQAIVMATLPSSQLDMPPPVPSSFGQADGNAQSWEQHQSIDDLKDKLCCKITDALDSGRLDEVMACALHATESGKEEADDALDEDIDCLRNKLHTSITSALETGTLEQIMQTSLATDDRPAVAPHSKGGQKTVRGSICFEPPPLPAAVSPVPPSPPEELTTSDAPCPPSAPPEVMPQPPKAEAPPLVASATSLKEDLRIKARNTLIQASVDDGLERALLEVKQIRRAEVTRENKEIKSENSPALQRALEAVAQRDRRVGELLVMISEANRQISDRDERCRGMEEKLGAARLDLAHLEVDVEWHRRSLEGAKEQTCALEAGQRKLLGDLDGQHQKLRHANVQVSEGCPMSALSEISTVTGGGTTSSVGCFTPRNAPSALSSSPLPSRW